MKKNEFIKILKEYENDPKRIIGKHIHSKINLTSKQLDIVIDLKNKEKTLSEVLEEMKERRN